MVFKSLNVPLNSIYAEDKEDRKVDELKREHKTKNR